MDANSERVTLSYASPALAREQKRQSFAGIVSCVVFLLLILCEIGGWIALQVDPDVKKNLQWAGLGEIMFMAFAPLLACPFGLLCALVGLRSQFARREMALIGFILNAMGLMLWFVWRQSNH
ncbi:MAG TPA: hypothetical protein VHS31_05880 [Tepidisphaeraceae bacterium]|jgi:hypothetical protein|nr:hypothetical protein [Tepidisphaeraceae bacterium]